MNDPVIAECKIVPSDLPTVSPHILKVKMAVQFFDYQRTPINPLLVKLSLAMDRIAKLEKQLAMTDIELMRVRRRAHITRTIP